MYFDTNAELLDALPAQGKHVMTIIDATTDDNGRLVFILEDEAQRTLRSSYALDSTGARLALAALLRAAALAGLDTEEPSALIGARISAEVFHTTGVDGRVWANLRKPSTAPPLDATSTDTDIPF